jgi:hypothetical protein
MVLKVMVSCNSHMCPNADNIITHPWNHCCGARGAVAPNIPMAEALSTIWELDMVPPLPQSPQVDFIMHICGCRWCLHAYLSETQKHIDLAQETLDPGSEGPDLLMQVASEAVTMTGQAMPWTFSVHWSRSFHLTYLDVARDGPMGKGAHNSWTWSRTTNQTWFIFISLSLCSFRKKKNVSACINVCSAHVIVCTSTRISP